jgi:hypothetical protein
MDQMNPLCSDAVIISVERLMRFCYLARLLHEQTNPQHSGLPPDLTRWGTLLFLTGSFLYSLFENDRNSNNAINLERVWSGFPHPFDTELHAIAGQLAPIQDDLRHVRNRYGFHGSLSRTREAEGMRIFAEPQAQHLRKVIGQTLQLASRMISWHMKQTGRSELIPAFTAELTRVSETQFPSDVTMPAAPDNVPGSPSS